MWNPLSRSTRYLLVGQHVSVFTGSLLNTNICRCWALQSFSESKHIHKQSLMASSFNKYPYPSINVAMSHRVPPRAPLNRSDLKWFSWFWIQAMNKTCLLLTLDGCITELAVIQHRPRRATRGATTTETSKHTVWKGKGSAAVSVFLETKRVTHRQPIAVQTFPPKNTWQWLCFDNTLHSLCWVWPTFRDAEIINTLKIWSTAPWLVSELRLADWSKIELIWLMQLHEADVCNYAYFLCKSHRFSAYSFPAACLENWQKSQQVKQWAGSVAKGSTVDSNVKTWRHIAGGGRSYWWPSLASSWQTQLWPFKVRSGHTV